MVGSNSSVQPQSRYHVLTFFVGLIAGVALVLCLTSSWFAEFRTELGKTNDYDRARVTAACGPDGDPANCAQQRAIFGDSKWDQPPGPN